MSEMDGRLCDEAEVLRAVCVCGHSALDHHGTDPTEGCLGVVSHRLPQCPCSLTAEEVQE